jgi:proteic killer suppression protein
MLDAGRIRNKALRRLFEKGDESGIRPDWLGKTKRVVAALHVAVAPEELDLPSFRWHGLRGDRAGTFAVSVSRNWRITFCWDEQGPFDVDLEDYHGD